MKALKLSGKMVEVSTDQDQQELKIMEQKLAASDWALNTVDYYNGEHFQAEHFEGLQEDLGYNEGLEYFLKQEFNLYNEDINVILLEAIQMHIMANHEDYFGTFKHWYVGANCVASISWGNQEFAIPEELQSAPALEEIARYFQVEGVTAYYDIDDQGIKYTIQPDDQAIINLIAKHRTK